MNIQDWFPLELTGLISLQSKGLSKTMALTRWTFVGKVMSLLFNMLSRLVIAFLSRNKHLLISHCTHHLQWFWNPPKIVSHCFHCFPIYLSWSDGTGCHLSFLNLEFQASFFTLLFHFQEASSSSLSAIRVASSAYLRLLIFLSAILFPACASSNPAFHMIYLLCIKVK